MTKVSSLSSWVMPFTEMKKKEVDKQVMYDDSLIKIQYADK